MFTHAHAHAYARMHRDRSNRRASTSLSYPFTDKEMMPNGSNLPKAIPPSSGGIYPISVNSKAHVFFHCASHFLTQHHRATNLWKLTLWFIDLTCDFMARGVIFPVCGFVCCEVFCPLAEDPSSPGGPLTVPTLPFRISAAADAAHSSRSVPQLRARSLQHCPSPALDVHCREIQETHSADLSLPGSSELHQDP